MTQTISVTGYSTALFATWYFVEEFGVLFDCGDGVISALLQKSRKIKHVFVSHADRDHLTGLLQFQQLNGRAELTIHYPKDSGSFPALADFTRKFDPHMVGTDWRPLDDGDRINVRNDLTVRAIRNGHVACSKEQVKSLSFVVESVSRKLKADFQGLSGIEIAKHREQFGIESMTDERRVVEFIYSGDTPVESDGRYQDAKVLVHESTFLTRSEIDPENPNRNKHSSLDGVMEMVASANIGTLILGHFSSRYQNEEIDEAIEREKKRCNIKVPVYRILPGELGFFKID